MRAAGRGARGRGERRRAPRLREPVRDEATFQVCDLDLLLDETHPARLIWAYASKVDLSDLEAQVKAREGVAGMPQTSLPLLLALWLYATTRGVGSARALARLCESEAPFRWLCGGVSVNHRMLSEFRAQEGERANWLLTQHVASLSHAGLINLDEIAQDGVRVRANAGTKSFRRRKTLEEELAKAKALLARLSKDEDDDPGASGKRQAAARKRAAREREARVRAALEALAEAEKVREKRLKSNRAKERSRAEPRASTTDPEARVMKMADGGFRPAYNLQFASLPETGIVVAVSCGNVGSDRALAEPMAQAIKTAYGRRADVYLVDGGYMAREDIEAAEQAGTRLYCPATKSNGAWSATRRAATTRRLSPGGESAWTAKKVALSTNGARAANSFTPGFATSASTACGCAAGRRSKPALAGSRSPPTSSSKPDCAPPRWPDRAVNQAQSTRTPTAHPLGKPTRPKRRFPP